MSDDPTIVPGGQGGSLSLDPHHTRAHLSLMEQMVRLGTLSPEQQGEIRDEALMLLRRTEKDREKNASLRVLAALERNDLRKLQLALIAGGVGRTTGGVTITGPTQINNLPLTDDQVLAFARKFRELEHAAEDQGAEGGSSGEEIRPDGDAREDPCP